ncbi:hypothetical protein A2V82_01765 [candidate division KSB1 bacterium RBG_16_48_16]|nr:MAG: hypothetical protein A2V82_01765 [candidate division KSB1 bacterium RBG_16_48_16]
MSNMDDITTTLKKHFGFSSFRPGQSEAIRHLLAHQNALVVMPTGAGKSLVYQLAALHLEGLTLVLSPLIALMKDQVDSLTERGIPATFINSTLSGDEQCARLEAMAENACRLVYLAPERLRSTAFLQALSRARIDLLAVDEAHCISQWGHDFRPDYLHISAARERMGYPLTVALTATATPQVQQEIVQSLVLENPQKIITGFNRPNLVFQVVYTTDYESKLQSLHDLFADWRQGASIVYTGTRRDAEEVTEFIRSVCDVEVEFYHAGLEAETRTHIQSKFHSGELPVVVATNAFGMGIDRQDVRMVIHFSIPGTLEAYYQEAGRAGRDGEPARAVLLYDPKDRALQEWFIENDAPAAEEMKMIYDALSTCPGKESWTTLDDLSLFTGLPEVKLKVGLAELEMAGSIRRLGDAGRKMLIHRNPWDRIAIRERSLHIEQRHQLRKQQLSQVIVYAESNRCRRQILLDHFGDRSSVKVLRCCDNCLASASEISAGDKKDIHSLTQDERVPLIVLDALRRLKWEIGAKKLARLLKGSRAGDIQQLDYHENIYFGRLAAFTMAEVKSIISQLLKAGYVKSIGGSLPVLRLTPKGLTAIKTRESIPMKALRQVSPEAHTLKKAEKSSGTVSLTAEMFDRGLTPEQIAEKRGLVADTIYNHLAQLIGRGEVELGRVVSGDVIEQIRAAAGRAGISNSPKAMKDILPDTISYGQIRCVMEAGSAAGKHDKDQEARGQVSRRTLKSQKKVSEFLSRPLPRPLTGPWEAGWALGFHSRFSGSDWSRSQVGELAYRLKYQKDTSVLEELVEHAASLFTDHPLLIDVDALVPVPPSLARTPHPVFQFTRALAQNIRLPVWPALIKTRQTAPQKEMHTLAQKRANVAGAFAVDRDVRGKRLLVIDDLYDSGATLEEISRELKAKGVKRLCVLTLTRTIHSDA